MEKKITVYCASSAKVDTKYFDEAALLGREIARNNYTLVYGGGAKGLMGAVAEGALQSGGKVIGYIPRFMVEVEWAKKDITELVLVEDMHERKKRLVEGVDAVVALPGGCGTLEELSEVLTAKRLGMFPHPIIIVNQGGFYDELVAFLERMIQENFMSETHRAIWTVVSSAREVIPAIESSTPWDKTIHDAAV